METYWLAGWNHLAKMGPTQIRNASGARIQIASGEWRDDYIMGWGSCFFGHDSSLIREAILRALSVGFLQQYETECHQLLSERFCAVVPCAEKLRLVNSGLEATMYATRIARAVTGRRLILKFEGHFHGLNDSLTWNVDSSAQSGALLPNGELERVAGTVGIPSEFGQLTLPLPWNDLDAVRRAFDRYSDDIARVILEPVALNIGCIKPDEGFLQQLREITTEHLANSDAYRYVAELERQLRQELGQVFAKHDIPCHIDGYGGRVGVHIGSRERPRSMREIEQTYPVDFANKLFHLLSSEYGLYGFLMPLTYCPEPATLSTAHTSQMISDACNRLDSALDRLNYHADR